MRRRSNAIVLAAALVAGGCATQAPTPPGKQADGALLESRIVPGATTRSQLIAWFGPTTQVRFESGYEAWVYQAPAGAGQFSEFVILLNPQGIVSKTRRRPPEAPPSPAR